MSIQLDNPLNLHMNAMRVRAKRAEVLSNNLANADTPNFKARDFDFKNVLTDLMNNSDASSATQSLQSLDLKYRNPMQPSMDGNTVDAHQEYVRFSDNALRYQASVKMLKQQLRTLQLAIRGQ